MAGVQVADHVMRCRRRVPCAGSRCPIRRRPTDLLII